MTYLFSRENRRLLRTFARSNVLLAFDFDGTLAPIVSSPDASVMRDRTRQLLKRASRLYPCTVISGRARRDVYVRLRGVGVRGVIGNHGAEPSTGREFIRLRVREWLPSIRGQLSRCQGVVVEDKKFSVAVHYRKCRRPNTARRAIQDVACSLDGARIVGGKFVVNLLVRDAPHKGVALERERRRLACDWVVYVGDDRTDEDVFRLDRPDSLLSVRVGRSRTSKARCYIRGQLEIDRFLSTFVSLRRGGLPRIL